MLLKVLLKKQSPLIGEPQKEYIKSTPFNTEPRTPYFKPSKGKPNCRKDFY